MSADLSQRALRRAAPDTPSGAAGVDCLDVLLAMR
jgi:hypothetical protein